MENQPDRIPTQQEISGMHPSGPPDFRQLCGNSPLPPHSSAGWRRSQGPLVAFDFEGNHGGN
jgi:hypothetical protein